MTDRARVLLFSLLAWTISNMDQSLFGYAVPGIVAEFGVGLETVGVILSISFVVASIAVVFAGLACDRYGRRWTLAALLGSSALMVGLHAWAPTIEALTAVRALGFALSAGLAPITSAYVAEAAPARWRGVLLGVLQCGYPLGWFVASLVAAPVLGSGDWRPMFLVGFAVVPLAVLIGWQLRESERFRAAASARAGAERGGLDLGLLKELFSPRYRRRSLAAIVLFLSFGCAYAGSAFYFPTFFMQVRGYSGADAAWLVGLSNGIAIVGYLTAAFVGEFVTTRRTTFVIWCLLGAVALLAFLWLPTQRWHDAVLFALTTSFFYGTNAVLITLMAELYPTRMRSTAFAACGSAPLSLGFAVYPSVVPVAVGVVGWANALSWLVVPMLVVAAAAALAFPNLRSGQELED